MRKSVIKSCEICGVEFTTRTTKRTCSRECQNKLSGYSLICVVCGKEFNHFNLKTKGCSIECKKIHANNTVNKCHSKDIVARRKLVAKSTRKTRSNFSPERKKEESLKHDDWRKNNPDKVKASKAKDILKNRESYRIRSKRNKAIRRKAGTMPSVEIISKRLNHFNGCCYCDRIEDLTLEHLVPISKGGTNREGNLYGACKSCNSSKQDKDFRLWYRSQTFYKPEREIQILRLSITLVKENLG